MVPETEIPQTKSGMVQSPKLVLNPSLAATQVWSFVELSYELLACRIQFT